MKHKFFICLFLCFFIFFIVGTGFAGGDDDGVVEYPDGSYGYDIGGGYGYMPDGKTIMPEGYRDPLADSEYGPMTQEGFLIFPKFRFPDSATREKKQKADKKKIEEMMFEEATTQPNTLLWGVSDPGVGKE
ncbi:MAG: hypothetical protein U9R44_00715 [Candidatus Omnitrophota bacterium]|nr:hypothetical protein [Candidatus Omnitrophota bacterium]